MKSMSEGFGNTQIQLRGLEASHVGIRIALLHWANIRPPKLHPYLKNVRICQGCNTPHYWTGTWLVAAERGGRGGRSCLGRVLRRAMSCQTCMISHAFPQIESEGATRPSDWPCTFTAFSAVGVHD